jgi:hypothetical protein
VGEGRRDGRRREGRALRASRAVGARGAVLLAVLAVACAPVSYASFYKCTTAQQLQCGADFDTCVFHPLILGSADERCTCWTDAFSCYKDCDRFPDGWSESCNSECPSRACSPPLRNGAPAALLAASGLVLVATVAVSIVPVLF